MRKAFGLSLQLASFAFAAFSICIANAAEKPVTIITGSPSFGTRIEPKRAEIEKAIGTTFEIKIAPTQAGVQAMVGGLVDCLSIGASPSDAWDLAQKGGAKVDDLDKYDATDLWKVMLKIALHPENPSKELSREQVTSILTGKVRNWESINGKKLPISVIFARDYVGAMKTVQDHYLGGGKSPIAEMVVNKDGILKRMKNDPGSISFFAFKEETPDFKPKYIESDAGHPSYFMIKKDARPAARKMFDYMKKLSKDLH